MRDNDDAWLTFAIAFALAAWLCFLIVFFVGAARASEIEMERPHRSETSPLSSGMGTAVNASPKTEAGFLAAYPHVHPAHLSAAETTAPINGYDQSISHPGTARHSSMVA